MSANHTPTPWLSSAGVSTFHVRGENRYIAKTSGDHVEDEANAEFIVRACNSIEELREVVGYLIQDQPGTVQFDRWWPERVKAARDALAKAGGVQ